jgi:glucosamine--fructose-6-phosphate aminotransferase (isomerizing)
MAAEMGQQPDVLRALVQRREDIVNAVRAVLPQPLAGLTLVARGSSDHAAVYGRYVLEMAAGRPASLAAPSIHTLYRAPIDYRGYLAVGLSQSGRTPEVVQVLATMRERGARTVALVNDDSSPLGDVADVAIDVGAGAEDAVPATKTFTATLVAVALLAEAFGTRTCPASALEALPEQVSALLHDVAPVERVVAALDGCDQILVTARGLLLVAALETALKIRETSAVVAEGMSSADLRHGPIAAVGAGYPVIAITGERTRADLTEMADALRARGAVVHVVSDGPDAAITLPDGTPEALLPVLAAVRGQQIAMLMATRRGLDPDSPGGLSKVTLTR